MTPPDGGREDTARFHAEILSGFEKPPPNCSSVTLSPDAIYLRSVASALHPDLRSAAIAAETDCVPEHHVSWSEDVDLPEGWLVGYELDNGGPDTMPYIRPVLCHPGTASAEHIRRVWKRYVEIEATRRILKDINAYRASRGLEPRPLPTFADLDQRQHTEANGYRGRT